MSMRTNAYIMTIADYYEQIRNRQITINHTYQRSDKVWPTSAKSNLIDTILNGYPIPKLIFSQSTDLDTRKTRKEVVDGQQRTAAIVEFLEDKYTLSRGDFVGHTYSSLDNDRKKDFVEYAITADMFTSATEEEIREVFRRINSYQVPLNKQETRHATHQGEFKWFVRDIGKRYATSLVKIGAVREKQISRMVDLEIITELVDALVNGIKTASPTRLDSLYTKNDKRFVDREAIEDQLTFGLGQIIDTPEIYNTRLVNRGNLYSLFCAFVAIDFEQSILRNYLPNPRQVGGFIARADYVPNLTALSAALDDDGWEYPEFVAAASQGTNTEKNRKTRFNFFYTALTSYQP